MTIVAAAIKVDDLVFSVPAPGRHADILRGAAKVGIATPTIGHGTYGFLTDDRVFLDRAAALQHVLRIGQPVSFRTPHALGLYSEDLW